MDDGLVTLGWQAIDWIETFLCHGPGDVVGQPIRLNDDQAAFLLRAYELVQAPDGRWRRRVRRAFLSRPKGSAKSELAGALCCFEALGPCRFDGMDANGDPVGRPITSPFIRCLATEEGQTGNTYGNVEVMLTQGPVVDEFPGLDVGITRTFLPGGGEIRPSTSGAVSKDGGKETFAVADEIHLYLLPEHKAMYQTVRRNLPKRRIADPWQLDTSTMYAKGEDSVAEDVHAYAQAIADGRLRDTGLLFDHRQGPTDFDFEDDDQLRAALSEAYGPVDWVDLDRLVDQAREPDTSERDFRRYYLNQAVASATAWMKPSELEPLWTDERVQDGDRVVGWFDGSRGSEGGKAGPADSTVLGVTRISDGLTMPVGLWEHEDPSRPWSPDREQVDAAVDEMHERFNVVRAYGDPPGWETDIDRWYARHGVWKQYPTYRRSAMTEAIDRAETDLRAEDVKLADSEPMRRHFRNVTCQHKTVGQRTYKTLVKPAQRDKVDLAVGTVIGLEARGDAIAAGEDKVVTKKTAHFIM